MHIRPTPDQATLDAYKPGYEVTGEYRNPKHGDFFWSSANSILQYGVDLTWSGDTNPRWILRKKETIEPKPSQAWIDWAKKLGFRIKGAMVYQDIPRDGSIWASTHSDPQTLITNVSPPAIGAYNAKIEPLTWFYTDTRKIWVFEPLCPKPSDEYLKKHNVELTGEYREPKKGELTHWFAGPDDHVDETAAPGTFDTSGGPGHPLFGGHRWILRKKANPVTIRPDEAWLEARKIEITSEAMTWAEARKNYPGSEAIYFAHGGWRYTAGRTLVTCGDYGPDDVTYIVVPVVKPQEAEAKPKVIHTERPSDEWLRKEMIQIVAGPMTWAEAQRDFPENIGIYFSYARWRTTNSTKLKSCSTLGPNDTAYIVKPVEVKERCPRPTEEWLIQHDAEIVSKCMTWKEAQEKYPEATGLYLSVHVHKAEARWYRCSSKLKECSTHGPNDPTYLVVRRKAKIPKYTTAVDLTRSDIVGKKVLIRDGRTVKVTKCDLNYQGRHDRVQIFLDDGNSLHLYTNGKDPFDYNGNPSRYDIIMVEL